MPHCLARRRLTKLIALKTITSLNKEARLLKFHFSEAIVVLGDNELRCSKRYDRKASAFRTSNAESLREEPERKLQMLLSLRIKKAQPPHLRRLGFSR